MEESYFTGPFASKCRQFVAQKQATGCLYETQSRRLKQFDNFCKDYDVRDYAITKEIALAWYAHRPNEKDTSRRDRVAVIQHFAEFLCKQGYVSFLFPALPKKAAYHPPYIFTKDEIQRIFNKLDTLKPSSHTTGPLMFPLLFRTLYGCGLRISEALSLLKRDIDLENGVLHIWHGKNNNERLVPLSKSLQILYKDFVANFHLDTPEDFPFFYTKSRTKYDLRCIGMNFRNILWEIGIPYRGKDVGPRVHDLRHTFVCHNIQAWTENNIPISSKLPILSKYLGHTAISATQWYLRLSAETYPHIREICEHELSDIYLGLPNFKSEISYDE
jgi:integrase